MIKKRAFTTLMILAIFQIGTFVPLPYIQHTDSTTALSNIVNLMSGNTLSRFGFLALGISPFIMASIIMQLMTKVSSKFHELMEQGTRGKALIAQYTRVLTLIMSVFMAYNLINNSQLQNTVGIRILASSTQRYELLFLLCVGALFTTYLAERINEKGIGQGASLLVAIGIFASLPKNFIEIFNHREVDNFYLYVFIILAAYLLILALALFASKKEYKFPIQSKANSERVSAHQYPIKLLISSIMPAIIASTVLGLVSIISTMFNLMSPWLSYDNIYGMITYTFLIIVFSFLFNVIQIDGDEISKSFDDGQLYFVGVSNLDTAKFINEAVLKITLIGTATLVLIVVSSFAVELFAAVKLQANITLTGISLLIVIGVISDLWYQIQGLRKSKELE